MPIYEFKCEVCGRQCQRRRDNKPPRFCSVKCRQIGMVGESIKPTKYIINADMHKQIKRLYQRPTGRGEIRDLAKKINLPRWKVTRYAAENGWIKTGKKVPPWSDAEIAILKTHARHCPDFIKLKLKEKGYSRTLNAIVLKRKRLRLSIGCLDGYSATSLAMCLGVDPHFVTTRIKKGHLKANKRVTNRITSQGGDIFWIKQKDIREWIIKNACDIDITKVDKFWFIDLLANIVP